MERSKRRSKTSKYLIWIVLLTIAGQGYGQDTTIVRVLSYNLLNYSGQDAKAPYFQDVIEAIDPDIIVAQEVVGTSGYGQFLSEVLNTGGANTWSGAPFTNQSAQQDIALYYKPELFTFLSTTLATNAVSSGLRAAVEFEMEFNETGQLFTFYGHHLKASRGASEAETRATEAARLRNRLDDLPPESYFLLCGDFNIYGSGEITGYSTYTEKVYGILTDDGEDVDGKSVDPLDAPGMWYNNGSFSWLHTQSTRTDQISDGGASGGLDDRFDFIFFSAEFFDSTSSISYVKDSYTSFGNDGNHFNKSINEGTNSAVSADLAEALYQASDHLPVFADIMIIKEVVSTESETQPLPETFSIGKPYPNPFNPEIKVPFTILQGGNVSLNIFDITGRQVAELWSGHRNPGIYTETWDAGGFPSGVYIVKLSENGVSMERKITLSK